VIVHKGKHTLLDILTRMINNVPTVSCENNSRNWPNWDAKGVHELVIRYT
jgi:hypothetical protein